MLTGRLDVNCQMSLQAQKTKQTIAKILELSEEGLSVRKIGNVVGVSHVYVAKIIKKNAEGQIIMQEAREIAPKRDELPFNQVEVTEKEMHVVQRDYDPTHVIDNANRLLITIDDIVEKNIRGFENDLKECRQQLKRIKQQLEATQDLKDTINLEYLLMRVLEKKGVAQHKMMLVKMGQSQISLKAVQMAVLSQHLPNPTISKGEMTQADPISVEAIIRTIRQIESPR